MKTQKWIIRSATYVIPLIILCLASNMARAQGIPLYTELNSWQFGDTNWWSDAGYAPVSFTNLVSVPDSGNGASLWIDGTNAAWLQYNCVENDGEPFTNITFQSGSIVVWFAPTNWSSVSAGGTGLSDIGELISVGSHTPDASGQFFGLYLDTADNLVFGAQSNGVDVTYVSAPVCFTNGLWHAIALTYDTNVSCIYVDGQPLATNGLGVSILPDTNTMAGGLFVGGSSTGDKLVHGLIDDLSTYDGPLDLDMIRSLAGFYSIVYDAAPLTFVNPAPSEPSYTPTFRAVSGSGYLNYLSNSPACSGSSSQVWITNATASLTTNGTINIMFTISGGSNVLYDVFCNGSLTPSSTNFQWAWFGQVVGASCATYVITNLPAGEAYFRLGWPTDSDNDGLPDAYELLISHSNPYQADSSGDGMLDGWKVLWGMNPSVNNITQPSERSNYGYDPVGWLETLTGTRAETVSLDPEGNIQTAQ